MTLPAWVGNEEHEKEFNNSHAEKATSCLKTSHQAAVTAHDIYRPTWKFLPLSPHSTVDMLLFQALALPTRNSKNARVS